MSNRPFDPQWTTDNQRLEAFLSRLCSELTAQETRTRKRASKVQACFEAAIRAIVLDLFRAHQNDPALEVGIGTGRTALQAISKSRYGASFISARTFADAMKAVQNAGLVLLSTPHWDDPEKKNSRVARYMAAPELLVGLRRTGATFVDLRRHKNAEGIRLKDSKKALVEYGDNAFANEARDRLHEINRMLSDHWADLALSDKEVRRKLREIAYIRKKTPAHPPDFTARTVYRVFNNRDWEQGGRFNGAWWIGCPSPLRPYILIDGKRTVEVDYSGLHPAMLFAEIGEDIPADPYARCVVHTGGPDERKLVKLTFNALLNAESVQQVGKVKGYSKDLTGQDWVDFKRFIVSSFPEFKQHFGSGVGVKLQRKDSDLAEAVMLKFAAMGYACLPVHDSFIVHHGMQGILTNTMKAVFEDMFGVIGQTDFDTGLSEAIEVTGKPVEMDMAKVLSPSGYEGRLQAFRLMREQE